VLISIDNHLSLL